MVSGMDNGTRAHGRLELVAALLLAMAAVTTAWAAFQSTKWGGVQADSYSQASAARVESTRASTEAGQLAVVDVNTFTSWVAALSAEARDGAPTGLRPDGTYTPQPGTESGFLFERFRDEFRPAVEAWLATRMPGQQWEVRNQARMHVRQLVPPFTSSLSALSHWVEVPTCIGVRLLADDSFEWLAPYGFAPNWSLQVDPNPCCRQERRVFTERVKAKEWQRLWPDLVVNWP